MGKTKFKSSHKFRGWGKKKSKKIVVVPDTLIENVRVRPTIYRPMSASAKKMDLLGITPEMLNMKMDNLEEKKTFDSFFITQQTSLSKATRKLFALSVKFQASGGVLSCRYWMRTVYGSQSRKESLVKTARKSFLKSISVNDTTMAFMGIESGYAVMQD